MLIFQHKLVMYWDWIPLHIFICIWDLPSCDVPPRTVLYSNWLSLLPQVPRPKGFTYAHFVASIRAHKEEQHRVRPTSGGNRLDYSGKTSTKTASLETIKILWNSVLSTKNSRFIVANIGNMYLNTKLTSPEYMKIHIKMIPDEIMSEYNILQIVDDEGFAYIKITGAIYCLTQSGYLANQDLIRNLAPFVYYPSACIPGLWLHKTRKTKFTLVVDNFGIKTLRPEDTQHLIEAITSTYPVKVDYRGTKYIGIDLKWDYSASTCRTSMNGYNKKALTKFGHQPPTKPAHGPIPFNHPSTAKNPVRPRRPGDKLHPEGSKKPPGNLREVHLPRPNCRQHDVVSTQRLEYCFNARKH